MRFLGKTAGLVCAASLLFAASNAHAFAIPWEGTLTLDLGHLGTKTSTGTGLADLGFGNGATETMNLRHIAGLEIDQTTPFPVTDPTVVLTVATVGTVASVRAEGIAAGPVLFKNLDRNGAMFNGQLPLPGILRFCFLEGCATELAVDLMPSPSLGVGIGGSFGATNGTGVTNVQIQASPWRIATSTMVELNEHPFDDPPATILTDMGIKMTPFSHAPGSSAAPTPDQTVLSGSVIQLISPSQISATGPMDNTDEIALFSSLTVRFVPEPGVFVLLGSGVFALILIGRSRSE